MKKILLILLFSASLFAQEDQTEKQTIETERVEVKPKAKDEEIQERLENILNATGWFYKVKVDVNQGVVFLYGITQTDEHKTWAGDLAKKTEATAAVVNKIQVEPSAWEFAPLLEGLRNQWSSFINLIPSLIVALIIFAFTWLVAYLVHLLALIPLRRKYPHHPLLQNIIAKAIGLGVFLIGLYIIFRLVGLTTIAFTVLGGTGLLGVILGIAFRDITENLLASIFLSIQKPFLNGDLVEIENKVGYVQRLTIRSTVLLTPEGNHVQIPNSTVYKSVIRNFSSNPIRREDIVIGIDYKDSISHAQEVALEILKDHPIVLDDPEPWVLVDVLDPSNVNLKIYFWIDGEQHHWLKAKSSIFRLIKNAFESENITMPDAAREVIFPEAIDVHVSRAKGKAKEVIKPKHETLMNKAEGGFSSDADTIKEQGKKSRVSEEGEDLLS